MFRIREKEMGIYVDIRLMEILFNVVGYESSEIQQLVTSGCKEESVKLGGRLRES